MATSPQPVASGPHQSRLASISRTRRDTEIAPYLNQQVGFVILNEPPTSAMRRDPVLDRLIMTDDA